MTDEDKQKRDPGTSAGAQNTQAGEASPAGGRQDSRQDSIVPGVKRPPHTIDLEAQEVSDESSAGTGSASPAENGEPDDRQAAPGAASAPGKEGAGQDAGQDADEGANAPGADPDGSKDAAPRREPPQRTTPAQLTGFVTHLAAGLLGGVAGVIGAGYLLPNAPWIGGVSQEYRQNVDSRIAKLESRLGAIEEGAAADIGRQDVEERIAGLEQRLGQRLEAGERNRESLSAASAAGRERLDRMEATLKAMEQAAALGGDVAQTAAIRAQVEAMTGETASRIAALRSDLDTLSGRLAANPAQEDAVAGQAARIETLARELTALQAGAQGADRAGGAGAAVSIRLAALAQAAQAGKGYADRLRALQEIAPQGVDLGALETWAAEGAPSRAQLERGFPAARKAALDAASRAGGGDSLLDRFLDSAGSVIRVRRVDGGGDGAGDGGPTAALAAIDAQLRQGGLEAAVARAEADGLPAPSREALGPWLGQARARIALDAAIAAVSDELARRLTADGPAR